MRVFEPSLNWERTKSAEQHALKRELGLLGATLSGAGVIIGAGIYALIGASAALAGGATWMAFALGAVVAGLTGISYARMGRRIPKNSPEFQYARLGLGPRLGFLAGWLMIWADIIAIAAVALGFGGYLKALVGVPAVLGGIALLVVVSLFAWRGIRESIALAGLFTLVEVGGLVLVAAIGVTHWGEHSLSEAPLGFAGIWTATTLSFFAYLGFDEIGNLAEEMRRPERDMPKAIALAVIISAALYILVAISAVSLVGWEALAVSEAPLATAVEPVLGGSGSEILALIALVATSSTVLLLLLSVSRSLYGMAHADTLPRMLGRVGGRKTPWVSIIIAGLLASAIIFLGDLTSIAQVANFSVLTSFSLVNLSAVIVLLRETPQATRSSRLAHLLSVLPSALAVAACFALLVMTGWLAMCFGIVFAGIGLVVGARWSNHEARAPLARE